jgi:CubicO group peptidase (beta-lactamase class C family)
MTNFAKVDDALRTAAETRAVPGVVAVATDGDRTIYEAAYGRRDLTQPAPMTADTVFWIASMTKAITGAAAMQLVEQGKLKLEQEMDGLLPELADPQVLEGFDADGKPKLRPAKRPITLRHLLTHTAGFAYDIWRADIGRYMELNEIPGIVSCQNKALTTPLCFDPGEAWHYGINIDWVGKAVEKASGLPLGDYFQKHLFDPLGMKDTAFKLTPDMRGRLAAMHARGADGSLSPIPFEVPQEPEFQMGGGGLYGTAPDYLRFVRMLMNRGRADGGQVLKPETVALMAQNHIGDLKVGLLRTAMPAYSNDAEFFPGMEKRWGLSFMLNMAPVPGGRAAGSLAWAGLGNTYFWTDLASRRGGVLMTQLLPFADAKVLALLDALEQGAYAA